MIKDERKAMVVLVFRAICRREESDEEEGEVIRSDDVDGKRVKPTSSEGAAAAIGNWSTVGGVVVVAAVQEDEESL